MSDPTTGCPYRELPQTAWWQASVVDTPAHEVMPIHEPPFRISRADAIATAGSCFARELARYLKTSGFTFLEVEPPPPGFTEEQKQERQYGAFSARYGNIYTARQLLQLLRRAFDGFEPAEAFWKTSDGRYIDPYRPTIEPGGFSSIDELEWDRRCHLAAVRKLFEIADVFVFTLGLTEAWCAKADGAVFPVCPGCGYGEFSSGRHQFVNFSSREIEEDLAGVHALLKAHNTRLRTVLTVSPVPLIASMSGRHVLHATTYSKAALRVAAEELVRNREDVCYFPAYEVIVGAHARGLYYCDDLRSLSRHGVQHVMRCFAAMFTGGEQDGSQPAGSGAREAEAVDRKSDDFLARVCDEEILATCWRPAGE